MLVGDFRWAPGQRVGQDRKSQVLRVPPATGTCQGAEWPQRLGTPGGGRLVPRAHQETTGRRGLGGSRPVGHQGNSGAEGQETTSLEDSVQKRVSRSSLLRWPRAEKAVGGEGGRKLGAVAAVQGTDGWVGDSWVQGSRMESNTKEVVALRGQSALCSHEARCRRADRTSRGVWPRPGTREWPQDQRLESRDPSRGSVRGSGSALVLRWPA